MHHQGMTFFKNLFVFFLAWTTNIEEWILHKLQAWNYARVCWFWTNFIRFGGSLCRNTWTKHDAVMFLLLYHTILKQLLHKYKVYDIDCAWCQFCNWTRRYACTILLLKFGSRPISKMLASAEWTSGIENLNRSYPQVKKSGAKSWLWTSERLFFLQSSQVYTFPTAKKTKSLWTHVTSIVVRRTKLPK